MPSINRINPEAPCVCGDPTAFKKCCGSLRTITNKIPIYHLRVTDNKAVRFMVMNAELEPTRDEHDNILIFKDRVLAIYFGEKTLGENCVVAGVGAAKWEIFKTRLPYVEVETVPAEGES